MTKTVRVSHDDRAVTIVLDRPQECNALDVDMSRALVGRCRHPSRDLFVLRSGSPGMFVSGTDVEDMRVRAVDQSLGRINSRLMRQVHDHPWSTIALVDRSALGGGCELVACELRIASTRSQALPEVRLGRVPSAGGLWRLAQILGQARGSTMTATGSSMPAPSSGCPALSTGRDLATEKPRERCQR